MHTHLLKFAYTWVHACAEGAQPCTSHQEWAALHILILRFFPQHYLHNLPPHSISLCPWLTHYKTKTKKPTFWWKRKVVSTSSETSGKVQLLEIFICLALWLEAKSLFREVEQQTTRQRIWSTAILCGTALMRSNLLIRNDKAILDLSCCQLDCTAQ